MKKRSSRKIKIKNTAMVKNGGTKWAIIVVILSFFISISMDMMSSALLPKADIITALLILLVLVFIGIIFDIVGVAVATADETPFHSMAAAKIKAAPQAIWLIRNAEKVSNICNDVIGDIVSVISGAATAVIVAKIINAYTIEEIVVSLLLTGFTASLTIGGKAVGKGIAMSKANSIIYTVARVISVFKNKK